MKNRCGLNLVQQLSNDTDKTLENIDKLEWPGEFATTFTSGALLMAKEVLKFARQDVHEDKRIVVTLTDGLPIDPDITKEAAATDKSEGLRLVFAGVGLDTKSKNYMRKLATKNPKDNFVLIKDLDELDQISIVNKLVEDVCGEDVLHSAGGRPAPPGYSIIPGTNCNAGTYEN